MEGIRYGTIQCNAMNNLNTIQSREDITQTPSLVPYCSLQNSDIYPPYLWSCWTLRLIDPNHPYIQKKSMNEIVDRKQYFCWRRNGIQYQITSTAPFSSNTSDVFQLNRITEGNPNTGSKLLFNQLFVNGSGRVDGLERVLRTYKWKELLMDKMNWGYLKYTQIQTFEMGLNQVL